MNRKKRKCIGAVTAAFGLGMLIAGFVPLMGYNSRNSNTAVGIYILMDNGC